MKPQRCHYSGFTLVELLVVIAIIAILAAVLSVSAGAAINAAKRAKAQNQATQIQTAIVNYYTEYGVYPLTSAQSSANQDVLLGPTGGTGTSNTGEADLFLALCGNINASAPSTPLPGNVPNTRNIAFLTPKKSDVDPNGVVVNPFSGTKGPYYYFSIAIDADYSGVLGDTGGVLTSMPDFINWKNNTSMQPVTGGITQSSAVWSCCDPANLANWGNSQLPSDWVHTY